MVDDELTSLIMSRSAALALPGRTLPAAPVRVIRTRWREDPYARGAYSYWAPGNLPGELVPRLFLVLHHVTGDPSSEQGSERS